MHVIPRIPQVKLSAASLQAFKGHLVLLASAGAGQDMTTKLFPCPSESPTSDTGRLYLWRQVALALL